MHSASKTLVCKLHFRCINAVSEKEMLKVHALTAAWRITGEAPATLYYQFTITPKNNAQVSLLSLDVALRVQPNGPKNYIWMYSLDNGENFSEMSGNLVFKGSTTDNNGIQQPTLNLEEVAGVQEFSEPMIVRIYAWGAADAKSTFRIGQSLANRPYALTLEGMIRP